jgi:ketosteroid isomerase-like protein
LDEQRLRIAMSDQPDGITQVLRAYSDAVEARDVETFLALYDDGMHLFDMWDHYEVNGKAAWREMVVGWFGAHPGKRWRPGSRTSAPCRGRMSLSRTW